MNDLSGVYNYQYQVKGKSIGNAKALVNGISWLALIITPWVILTFLALFTGHIELSVSSQVALSIIAVCALPQFFKL